MNPARSSKYQPLQAALTPDDRLTYVSCFKSDEVRVIGTAAQTVIAAIAVGKSLFLLEVTPDGQFLYIANQQSNNLCKRYDLIRQRLILSLAVCP